MSSEQWIVGDAMTNASALRVKSFRDLHVWQRSMEMTVAIYRLTQGFPRDEMFGLTSQLRRAAVSIPSNIAEGQARLNTREFRQFLGIARGSNCELQTQLEFCRSLGLGDPGLLEHAESLSHEIGKMIFTILGKLRT
ncbi:MAG: four helix bundle protein [Terracidiphilus sp.]